MSLTVLVMLLPNVCNSISKQLPELFFILYRIMCWRQDFKRGEDEKEQYVDEPVWPLGNRRESWEAAGDPDFSSMTYDQILRRTRFVHLAPRRTNYLLFFMDCMFFI